MRLLMISENDELCLVERVGSEVEPYAILSHTWGKDEDEISYKDFVDGTYKSKKGFLKLDFCRRRIALDDLRYFWVDTCCIDKSSSAELTEAINSMYRWYQGAAICYVYLSDVAIGGSDELRNSRWFRRGWTLQELIAPRTVDFFDLNGECLGNKISLSAEIHEATKLPFEAIRGRVLDEFSVDERLSWAQGRETKREEDAVYSLLGIFDVYMPLIYGEGRQRAFRRLMKELRDLRGNDMAWEPSQPIAQDSGASNSYGASIRIEKVPTFERQTPIAGTLQDRPIATMPMWPGNFLRTKQSGLYLQRRDMIRDAAYSGTWDEVLELIDIASEDYNENWSNAIRLRHPHEARALSFWTILHQAAMLRAPMNIIKHLIDKGALRTIRTVKTNDDFTHNDCTAADIARESGHAHLAGILAPIIYHPVPHQTLARLQSLFYEIIRADLGVHMAQLVLPDLVALTELRVPEMWFPVGEQGNARQSVGYWYKLEDRTLVVTKLGLEEQSPSVYRIE